MLLEYYSEPSFKDPLFNTMFFQLLASSGKRFASSPTGSRKFQYVCTEAGFISNLTRHAKGNQKKRYTKKGLVPPVFALNKEFVQALYLGQDGKGYYSHMSLNLRPLCDWQMSLERLNPNSDYVAGNVALVACEFNGSCQWTMDKITQMPSFIHARKSNVSLDEFENAKIKPKSFGRKEMKRLLQGNLGYCHHCRDWKKFDEFYESKQTKCKLCCRQSECESRQKIRGFIMHLFRNARSNCKKKKSCKNHTRNEFTLKLEDVFEILQKQLFRCKYSGIPMTFVPKTNWRCSLERLDNLKGYTKSNCVLVCFEFNASDKTALALNKAIGSPQWSKEKFALFYQTRYTFLSV